ncbi:dihydrodipicolinate synthase family protein [Faunimonas sp. B44]|uniref:dihydrodipicolinate synthase family protein n=1 Tax=Faunimonas sp. B44 TaxID=3461493 RepID=UPI004044F61E
MSSMTRVPRGIIHCPVTPFDPANAVDLDTFARVVEFLLRQEPAALCVNLHLAESLNLTLEERMVLAEAAVAVAAGRAPVIVNVSTPGTDQAITLARHAEKVGADCLMAITPYHWKPSQDAIYAHFAALMTASALPMLGYNSPHAMGGIGFAPATLVRIMRDFPRFIGLKEASHNWETYVALGRAGRSVMPDFGLFVGTEWMIPSFTLGGVACMSIQGGVAPRLVKALHEATVSGRLADALPLQEKLAELFALAMPEYPAPSKAMWEIMGRPVGKPRLPNRPLGPDEVKALEGALARLGILDGEPHGWD